IVNLDGIDSNDFIRQFMCSTLHRKITMSKLILEFKKYYLKNVKHGDLLGEYQYYFDSPEIDNEEDDEDEDLNDDIINEGIEDPIESDEKFKFTIIEFLQ